MAGEADEPDLARLFRLDQRLHRAALLEDAVRIVETQDLVMLHEIDVVGLQTLQGLLELRLRELLGAAVDLRHQEGLVAVAALGQRGAHAHLALAVVVVPAVVEEIDAAVERRLDQLDGQRCIDRRLADVGAAEADRRDLLAGAAEWPVEHVATSLAGIGQLRQIAWIERAARAFGGGVQDRRHGRLGDGTDRRAGDEPGTGA